MNVVPKVPNNCCIHFLKLIRFKNHKKEVNPQKVAWLFSNDTQMWLKHISGLENEENTIILDRRSCDSN